MTQLHYLRCTFIPQVWLLDYAYEVELPNDFRRNWCIVHQGRLPEERSLESDALRDCDAAPDWVKHWPGPFEIDYEVIQPSRLPLTSIGIDVMQYINDCPPSYDPIDEALISDLAEEIVRRFDCTGIYDQIDSLWCAILRERGTKPSP